MELEDCEKETKDKIKELNISAKLSFLSKEIDTLLLATELQLKNGMHKSTKNHRIK